MHRRALRLAPVALSSRPLLAAPYRADLLETGFDRLDPPGRADVQAELRAGGLYPAALDGRWGPGTEAALVKAADVLAWQSHGAVRVDLTTPRGVASYLRGLTAGQFSAWLAGEDAECAAR